MIVNIWGRSVEEYALVAEKLSEVKGVDGLEVNISCPNIKEGGLAFGADAKTAGRVIAAVRGVTELPLIPKLPPNVADIRSYARVLQDCGADAVSLINSVPAMVIDVDTLRPVLANVTGGLSGPAVHPIAVKLVWEVAHAVSIPIIGMGGITDARGAMEFILAGASAVAVGTANFTDPRSSLSIIDGMGEYLDKHEFASVREAVGALKV